MMNSLDFTGIIRNIVNEDPSRLSNFKLGTVSNIDGKVKIVFDGEETESGKGYSFLQSYIPKIGDRILLIKMSGTYVIVDRVITGAETNQIKYTRESDFNAHLAEITSKIVLIDAPVNQTTTTTVSLGFRPKTIQISAVVLGQKLESEGKWAENNSQFYKSYNKGADTWIIGGTRIIDLKVADNTTFIQGQVINVTNDGFSIQWNLTGTMPGTTRRMFILATTHGGA